MHWLVIHCLLLRRPIFQADRRIKKVKTAGQGFRDILYIRLFNGRLFHRVTSPLQMILTWRQTRRWRRRRHGSPSSWAGRWCRPRRGSRPAGTRTRTRTCNILILWITCSSIPPYVRPSVRKDSYLFWILINILKKGNLQGLPYSLFG